jgi:hypothetical protein
MLLYDLRNVKTFPKNNLTSRVELKKKKKKKKASRVVQDGYCL